MPRHVERDKEDKKQENLEHGRRVWRSRRQSQETDISQPVSQREAYLVEDCRKLTKLAHNTELAKGQRKQKLEEDEKILEAGEDGIEQRKLDLVELEKLSQDVKSLKCTRTAELEDERKACKDKKEAMLPPSSVERPHTPDHVQQQSSIDRSCPTTPEKWPETLQQYPVRHQNLVDHQLHQQTAQYQHSVQRMQHQRTRPIQRKGQKDHPTGC